MKVIRIQTPSSNDDDEFTVQVLSGVRFAPLVKSPSLKTVIPARIWSPESHHSYPESFRKACKQILLCCYSNKTIRQDATSSSTPLTHVTEGTTMLPRAVWMEVLSYTTRDWFEPPMDELEYLRKRLRDEQANTERANRARLEAESRCQLAERERDVYRLLARRWRTRLNDSRGVNNDAVEDNIEEVAAAMLLGGREPMGGFGLGRLFRRFRARAMDTDSDEEGQEDDEESDDEEIVDDAGNDNGVPADDDREEEFEDDQEEIDSDTSGSDSDRMEEDGDEMSADGQTNREEDEMDTTTIATMSRAKSLRPQVRTVSIAEDDL